MTRINDTTTERLLPRRTLLAGLGLIAASGFVAACSKAASSVSTSSSTAQGAASPSVAATGGTVACVLTAEQEQGPYWYHAAKVRSDITDGKPGVPMKLAITVVDATTCQPVQGAGVDIWHADALGNYSTTSNGLFLRGIQMTGADGVARFDSIYPGWYPSRTNHVHVKVHLGGQAGTTYTGGHVSHTGNMFFPEETSVAMAKLAPYTSNTVKRVTLTQDFVYKGQNGAGSLLTITPIDGADPSKGVVASMVVGVDPKATPTGIGLAGEVN
jgi:protocatechuate 3,4-dioxygenase beta subunit